MNTPHEPREKPTETDFEAQTLSDQDREEFLRLYGLGPETPEAEAAQIRADWPDEKILFMMESGQY